MRQAWHTRSVRRSATIDASRNSREFGILRSFAVYAAQHDGRWVSLAVVRKEVEDGAALVALDQTVKLERLDKTARA